MSKWYATCVTLRLERGNGPEGWKQLHVGGVDKIGCLQSSDDDDSAIAETLGVEGGQNGSERRLTMYIVSLDIKTDFGRGNTKAYCDNFGWAGHTWVDSFSFCNRKCTYWKDKQPSKSVKAKHWHSP